MTTPKSSDHPEHGSQRGSEFTLKLPPDALLVGGDYACSVRWFRGEDCWWLFWKHADGHWVTHRPATAEDLALCDSDPGVFAKRLTIVLIVEAADAARADIVANALCRDMLKILDAAKCDMPEGHLDLYMEGADALPTPCHDPRKET